MRTLFSIPLPTPSQLILKDYLNYLSTSDGNPVLPGSTSATGPSTSTSSAPIPSSAPSTSTPAPTSFPGTGRALATPTPTPAPAPATTPQSNSFPEASITSLQNLGIDRGEAIRLLEMTGGNADMAASLLFGGGN